MKRFHLWLQANRCMALQAHGHWPRTVLTCDISGMQLVAFMVMIKGYTSLSDSLSLKLDLWQCIWEKGKRRKSSFPPPPTGLFVDYATARCCVWRSGSRPAWSWCMQITWIRTGLDFGDEKEVLEVINFKMQDSVSGGDILIVGSIWDIYCANFTTVSTVPLGQRSHFNFIIPQLFGLLGDENKGEWRQRNVFFCQFNVQHIWNRRCTGMAWNQHKNCPGNSWTFVLLLTVVLHQSPNGSISKLTKLAAVVSHLLQLPLLQPSKSWPPSPHEHSDGTKITQPLAQKQAKCVRIACQSKGSSNPDGHLDSACKQLFLLRTYIFCVEWQARYYPVSALFRFGVISTSRYNDWSRHRDACTLM